MSLFEILNGNNYGVYNRSVAREIGLNATVVLSEILDKYSYFKSQEKLIEAPGENGLWFYLTGDTIEDRTSLTEKEQRPCIKKLVELGLIKITNFGLPYKRHFQVCEEEISKFILSINFSRTDKRPTLDLQKVNSGGDKRPGTHIEEPKEETKKKECLFQPPGGGVDPPKMIKKFDTSGKEITFDLDTIFRRAIQTNKDWKTSEINEAWEILVKYEGRVNDCMAFIEGTVKNLRKKQISKIIIEKESTCPINHERQGRRPTMAEVALAERPSHLADYVRQTKGGSMDG